MFLMFEPAKRPEMDSLPNEGHFSFLCGCQVSTAEPIGAAFDKCCVVFVVVFNAKDILR